jgi:hypothetical protein
MNRRPAAACRRAIIDPTSVTERLPADALGLVKPALGLNEH